MIYMLRYAKNTCIYLAHATPMPRPQMDDTEDNTMVITVFVEQACLKQKVKRQCLNRLSD